MMILLIDDDPICNLVSKKMIEKLGTHVSIKSYLNAQSALEFLETSFDEEIPYHILLDINMPELSGWEFLEALKELKMIKCANLSIHMVSSSTDESDKRRAAGYSLVKGYVNKPLSLEKLKLILHK